MADQERALIVGVGEGLSASLARLFAGEGMKVALAARNTDKLTGLADTPVGGHRVTARSMQPMGPLIDVVGPFLAQFRPALRRLEPRATQWAKHTQRVITVHRVSNLAHEPPYRVLGMRQIPGKT